MAAWQSCHWLFVVILASVAHDPSAAFGAKTTAYTYNLAGQGESETITGGILDGVVIDPGHDALLRRNTLNAGGAGWTYQQTYGFDTAGRLNAIGFGDHAFSYGYVPNSNLIQTVTSRTAGNDILTATKTWDNLNRTRYPQTSLLRPSQAMVSCSGHNCNGWTDITQPTFGF